LRLELSGVSGWVGGVWSTSKAFESTLNPCHPAPHSRAGTPDMALLAFDGFDHYATTVDLQSRVGVLQWSDLTIIRPGYITFTTGAAGYGQAINLYAGGGPGLGGTINQLLTSAYFGSRILISNVSLTHVDLQVMDYVQDLAQLTVRLDPRSGIVSVYSGDPDTTFPSPVLLAMSTPNAFSPHIWNYVEVFASIGTGGAFDVHVQGSSVVSGSGVLVQYPTPLPAGKATRNDLSGFRYRLGEDGNTQDGVALSIDDFYVCDSTTGPGTYPCNSFLGDVAVQTLTPTANVSVQWTPLAGTNYTEVSTAQFEGDLSYNSAGVVGAADVFTLSALPTSTLAVFGVQLTGAYRKLNASAQTIVQTVTSGGTAQASAPLTMSLAYAYYSTMLPLDPHTSASWTPAAVNLMHAGYTLHS